MSTAHFFDSFILDEVVSYLKVQEFAQIEALFKDSRKRIDKNSFITCIAYGFPGLQVDTLQQLLKELPRVHLLPVLMKSQRKVNQHSLAGFGYTNTFVTHVTFPKRKLGRYVRIKAETGSQSWTDCWISSAATFEIASPGTGLCKFDMRLLLSNCLQKAAVAVRCTHSPVALDRSLLVDVEAFRNSVMTWKMIDTSVKVNGAPAHGGMIRVKKMKDIANSLQYGLTCAIAVRAEVYGYEQNRRGLDALQIDRRW